MRSFDLSWLVYGEYVRSLSLFHPLSLSLSHTHAHMPTSDEIHLPTEFLNKIFKIMTYFAGLENHKNFGTFLFAVAVRVNQMNRSNDTETETWGWKWRVVWNASREKSRISLYTVLCVCQWYDAAPCLSILFARKQRLAVVMMVATVVLCCAVCVYQHSAASFICYRFVVSLHFELNKLKSLCAFIP